MAFEDEILSRQMPHSLEAEQSALGSMLIDADCIKDVMDKLQPDDFYVKQNRDIFETIYTMFSYSKPVDGVTVAEEMQKNGTYDDQTTRNYLIELMEITPTSANVMEYVKIIQNKSLLRSLAKAAGEITAMVQEGLGEAGDILEASEQRIYAIRRGRSSQELTPVAQLIKPFLDRLNELASGKTGLPGLPSGFSAVDQKIHGLNRSDLILLAARPGVGKSSFAMNMALNVAKQSGRTVAVFSLEMSKEQLLVRLLAAEGLVELTRLSTGRLSASDWGKLTQAARTLRQTDIRIDDNPMLTAADMNAKCRRLDGLLQPIFQPHGIPVLEFDLQIVRFILLVVRVGGGQQVGLDGFGNIHTVKGDFNLCPAGILIVAHFAPRFHGGRVARIFFSGSGRTRTIPAGKVWYIRYCRFRFMSRSV